MICLYCVAVYSATLYGSTEECSQFDDSRSAICYTRCACSLHLIVIVIIIIIAMRCFASAAYAVMRCLSVHLSRSLIL